MGDLAVKFQNVSKFYKLYNSPKDRLKEALHPLGKKFHKEFYALNNISFELKKEKILGIIGKNGSGKSTLLKLIAQVLVPSSGSIQVDGNISALIELGAGFNPQFTGLDNVFFYGSVLGFSRGEMQNRLDDILAFADIGEFIHQPIKTYSNGMRARLAFAVATEIDPEILILDEILSVGDAIFQRKCFAKINSMFKNGKTVILVSHNRNNIVGLCEKALLIDSGELLCYGEAEEVVEEYEILCNRKYLESAAGKKEAAEAESDDNDRREEKKQEQITDHQGGDHSSWDHSLVSDDKIFFKKSEIDFEDFGIYDHDGNRVNILDSGSSYKIKASFLPGEDLYDDITFAIRIKNVQGYVVAWVGFPFQKDIFLNFNRGERTLVEFIFDNNLLFGEYTIDAGLQSFNENELFIHVSINNLFLFRVNKDFSSNKHGVVDLNCRLEADNEPF